MSCGVGHRQGSDPELLWLWCRPAAIAPIRPLSWKPPYAAGAALEKIKKKKKSGIPEVVQRKWIWLGTMRLQVPPLASLSGLRIRHCHELWCMSKIQLGSGVAVAVALIRPLAWECPYAAGAALKSKNKKQNKTKKPLLLENASHHLNLQWVETVLLPKSLDSMLMASDCGC